MIITRSWLEEFIDLEDVSNQKLYELFNSIGLEVDRLEEIDIPNGVVVGHIISCKKHPDADKLRVCEVDIGEGVRQIVCGAANVKNAEYVAVATIGTTLPGNFQIKPAELRGLKSEGMICSSDELGLPNTGDGIMELDESIGILDIGRDLNEYPKFADTIIELELTANRGDCLSIHGVARDLGAILSKDILPLSSPTMPHSSVAIAKELSLSNNSKNNLDLLYRLCEPTDVSEKILTKLRLGYVGLELGDPIDDILAYSTHATGVILRAYDMAKLQLKSDKVVFALTDTEAGLTHITNDSQEVSVVGINQSDKEKANHANKEILFEASYIQPQSIIEGVSKSKVQTDSLFYNTSRGSEPDLNFGFRYLELQINQTLNAGVTESYVSVESDRDESVVPVFFEELDQIIGSKIGKSQAHNILTRLGFAITKLNSSTSFTAIVPQHRHDIENIQDIAEELLRIIGIDKIEAQPLQLIEKDRINSASNMYAHKKSIRQRASGNGFYEAVTYCFSEKAKLKEYGFETVKKSLDLVNPIAEELNTLRTSLLPNLLDSVARNTSYGIKRVPLFEMGTVFDADRKQKEAISFLWSGALDHNNLSNQGKPQTIKFSNFVEKVSGVIGQFELIQMEPANKIMHPFQSASILQNGVIIGYISKLHPTVAKKLNIPDTFIAEFQLESILPKHINSTPISNFQGVYKDLSIVIDQKDSYSTVSKVISGIDLPILRHYFPIDIYTDEELQEKKSLTIRLYIQSSQKTLSEEDIESVVQTILKELSEKLGATLR